MSFEDEHRAVILLISADRYTALHQWLQELLSSQTIATEIKLIDLSGEFNVDYGELTANNNCIIHNFNHAAILERLWEQLNPHAKEWWQLLDIANKQSIELPPLPGIDDLTRLILFSEALDFTSSDTLLIAILPTPLHALKMLGMAQQGPALIDELLEPLLNWWDTTRKTLSAVEKILRLRLPSSQKLRLNDALKNRFHLLQKTISNRSDHHFTLILDGKNYKPEQIKRRLSVAGMHRALPHLLIVEEASKAVNIEIKNECQNGPISTKESITIPDLKQKVTTTNPNNTYDLIEKWNTESLCVEIFLPGVSKVGLNVQQIAETIHLTFNGYCRRIILPTEFSSKQCERAQITNGWLSLWFSTG